MNDAPSPTLAKTRNDGSTIGNPYHCDHGATELRRRVHSNGSVHYQRQCLVCGAGLQSLKKDSPEVIRALNNGGVPDFDDELRDSFCRKRRQTTMLDREAEREAKRAEWLLWYSEYLKSPKWQEKRRLVLQRDDHVCQGCRRCRATQVHHLTYEHVGDELLFELVSVCDDCHDRSHGERSFEQWISSRLH